MSSSPIKKSYIQILPLDSSSKIDIYSVFNRIQPQISKWIDQFVNLTAWETDIHAEFNYPDLFRHFYFENKNIQKTRGQHTFGFGFPMLFDTDKRDEEGNNTGEIISAPLFTWYLNIRPHPNRSDSWLLSFEEGGTIAINDYLLAHIQEKYGLDLTDSFTDFVHNRPLTLKGLEDFCARLSERVLFKEAFSPSLRECPREMMIKEYAETGRVVWCGALGLFPQQEGSLREKSMQDIDFKNFTWTAEHAHEFAVLPEDAYQRAALRTVLRNKITVVEGSHGTGKTHLATNILLNALSNGQKTAVVANDIGTLMQIQNEFVKMGLGNLTFLLKDIYQDKKLLLDVLRNEQSGKSVDFKEEDFKIALKQARRLLAKSDDSHDALSQPIFGNEPFSEVVGFYLKSQAKEGRELLANHLNAVDYEFSLKEYTELRAAIQKAEVLFKNVNTLRHPLSSLHPSVFEATESAKGNEWASRELTQLIEKWKALHHRYIAVYDSYAQKLMNYYEAHYVDLVAQMRLLKESYSDYQFQFGEDFESNNFFRISGLRAASLFSDRSKNILSAKDEALNQYDALSKIYKTRAHFTHTFLNNSDRKDLKKLQTNLETFELSMKGWRKALPVTIQEELQRLNSKTAQHFDKPLAEKIRQLEQDLETLMQQTNERKLFSDALSHKMLTLPKRMLYIEDTVEKLEESQLNMRDFSSFYDWQRYWIHLPENGRKLMQSLIKVKPNDWADAFDSWYFYNTLVVHYQSSTLDNDGLMNQMCEAEDKLRLLMPTQIAYSWNERKKEAIRALKSKDTEGYRLLFSAKNQELSKKKYLKQVLKSTISTLSEIYPVLLTTPQVTTQLIESDGKEFDLVVFDNAQNLDVEQIVPILRNTEGVAVLTEFSKLDGISPNSLAAAVKKQDAATVKLNYLHRPISETARRLNQSVFYPDLEVPFRNPLSNQTVSVTHVRGKYNEKTESNDAEIEEVVRLLEEIHATPFNTFPRVGVVCMNKKQRNALSNRLLHIVQKTMLGWEKIEQLQRNGLGIYSIEELAGLQFDALVMCGTFESFEKWTISRVALRKILNCFTQNLYWVNSIPHETLAAASQDKVHEGAFLLSNLVFLSEKISLKDNAGYDDYDKILDNLKSLYTSPKEIKKSVFVEEVVAHLSHFIEPQYLKTNYFIDNHTFPIVILPKHEGQQPVIVRIDGKLSEGKYFSPIWERRILKELEKIGMPVISIWSYNWWKNPKDEAFYLAQKVFAYDKTFEEKIEETPSV